MMMKSYNVMKHNQHYRNNKGIFDILKYDSSYFFSYNVFVLISFWHNFRIDLAPYHG